MDVYSSASGTANTVKKCTGFFFPYRDWIIYFLSI